MDFNVLREHDIRGVYPSQINKEIAYRIGEAFGSYVLSKNVKECIIGHDNRLSGEELHDALISGLLTTGINVLDIGLATSPLFNYSSILAEVCYGIMITASHNPAHDNGFKIFGENYLHLEHEELQHLYSLIRGDKFTKGSGEVRKASYKDKYIEMLIEKGKNIENRLKIVIDCGNGTPSILVKDIFDQLNVDVTYLNIESDGSFPVHNPDPNDPKNLKWLQDAIALTSADVGIGFDGDGDRVGIVCENGEMIGTDILIGIFAGDIISKATNKNVLYDVKCSKALEGELIKVGANPLMLKNGSAYIETQMYKTPALIGGEYSGHIFFRDDYYGFDDGIYGGIRFIELLSRTGKKPSELHEHMDHYLNTPEIRLTVDDNLKWEVLEKVKNYALDKEYDINTIDGVRVNYEDGFSLIRCSNTSPQITMRFEAKDEETLELRKREFLNYVEYLIK